MKIISIQRTDKTPEVTLDTDEQVFQIKGNCLPENIREFSHQVITKFEEYLNQLAPGISDKGAAGIFRVNFQLGYFNSAAAKFIADVLIISGNFIQKGCNIKIYWYFDHDDHDMLEAGEQISEMVGVPMEFISVVKG
jgi:hypothetical protein